MSNFFLEIFILLKESGIVRIFTFLWRNPLRSYHYKRKKIFVLNNMEDIFTEIYKLNYWGNKESFSGSGSTLRYTENLRKNLPELFTEFSIKSIFDAPCGDFNWMRHILEEHPLNYIGGDIVYELVLANNKRFKSGKTKFIHIDITKNNFPDVDLVFCRDCLFHFSYKDAQEFIKHFINSNIPYLLTTTHVNANEFENKDICTGDYRRIDLFSHPYNFSRNVLARIDDWQYPEPRREMCLWSREQLLAKNNIIAWQSQQSQEPTATLN